MRSKAALTEEEERLLTEHLVSLAPRGGGEEGVAEGPVLGGFLYAEHSRDPQKAKNFDLHYLAFAVSGWASDSIQYFTEFELEHGGAGGNSTFAQQAYLVFWLNKNLAGRIGGILTPFHRFDDLHDPISSFTIVRGRVEVGGSAYNGACDDDGDSDFTIFGCYGMVRTPIADFWGSTPTTLQKTRARAGMLR